MKIRNLSKIQSVKLPVIIDNPIAQNPHRKLVRCYVMKNYRGEITYCPSVTTYISATCENYFLLKWIKENKDAGMGAANNGTNIHNCAENFIKGKPINLKPAGVEYWGKFEKFLTGIRDSIIGTECTVINPDLLIGGKLDAIQMIDGGLKIYDWKTSGKKKYKSGIKDYALQLSIYINLFDHTYRKQLNGLKILEGEITLISPNSIQNHIYSREELEEMYDDFITRRYMNFWRYVQFQK